MPRVRAYARIETPIWVDTPGAHPCVFRIIRLQGCAPAVRT
jgi:hypothetical protein